MLGETKQPPWMQLAIETAFDSSPPEIYDRSVYEAA